MQVGMIKEVPNKIAQNLIERDLAKEVKAKGKAKEVVEEVK